MRRRVQRNDAGFATLTLVMSTIAMVAVVLAALTAIWTADNVQITTSGITAAASTSQVMSERFSADVQGATSLSEDATTVSCGSGTLVLGMVDASGTVAYSEQTSGAMTHLVRTSCTSSGASTTVEQNVTSVVLSMVTGATTATALHDGWVNANAVGFVTLALSITGDRHTAFLTGAPEAGGAL
jgi:hypothetical protein